ncbi:hypothetical protein ADUPG1_008935 [Aduncisulcus paluster]|uniref:Uncharacterized protein n=1 Tax=Aduncisulcus paluster TaxID=2918883 RepID=A0ABQ5KTT1_9EUKA|nr:hypothetical protein ADUPG1_008935 [Aduncisulcus paluster]
MYSRVIPGRIPRPVCFVDLCDDKVFRGQRGYVREYCVGGNIVEFAKSWCSDGKYCVDFEDDKEEESSSSSTSDSDSSSESSSHKHLSFYDPKTMNPVKLSSVCVEMIECLDDIFLAKEDKNYLIHRN